MPFQVTIREDGICRIEASEPITVDQIRSVQAMLLEATKGHPERRFLMNAGGMTRIPRDSGTEFRAFLKRMAQDAPVRIAVFGGTTAIKVMLKFMKTILPRGWRMEIFDDETKAVAWLRRRSEGATGISEPSSDSV